MGLRAYIIKRLIIMFILILGVLTLNFFIFEAMPGNPLEAFLQNPSWSIHPEAVEELKRIYGIGLPWYQKYPTYLINMLTFNFGHTSPTYGGQKVEGIIFGIALPNTLLLIGTASIFATIIGIIIGAVAARRRGSYFDTFFVAGSLVTASLPTFWMGIIAQYIFGFTLKILPVQGTYTLEKIVQLSKNPILFWLDRLQYMVLPGLVLMLYYYGAWVLLTRACMLEVLNEDYIVTARAKGVKERNVIFKHALKNASLPLITNIAMSVGIILSGAIITEGVFNYGGLGTEIYKAIASKETPLLQAIFYVISLCVIIANFIADILYGVIDPRIKYG
jgi:peptide/nickel transport system permease protein